MNHPQYDLPAIYDSFDGAGSFIGAQAFGSGHINSTYHIRISDQGHPGYVLQRINHLIFRNVDALMENIERVTGHLRRKILMDGGDPDRQTLTLIPARTGKSYMTDETGNFWRMYRFINRTRSYDMVVNPLLAREGGRTFGRFMQLLADLPGGPLHETIPKFHDLEWRLQAFEAAVSADARRRAGLTGREIDAIRSRADVMQTVLRLGRAGLIPFRITHNDTKFNNLLFDEHDQGLCVVDLDTVMPGHVHYDFGDSIRTVTSTALEDESDLTKVEFNIGLFDGFAAGFLEQTRAVLVQSETEQLVLAARLMPYIMGLRFLTDYLVGDSYYKIAYSEHNLVRARNQFKLLASMERQQDAMQRIIERHTGGH
jgi:hypothetical protein